MGESFQKIAYTITKLHQILKMSIWYKEKSIRHHQFEGKHCRVFHMNGCFDPRDVLMGEIRGDYEEYSKGEIISSSGREAGAILVAGMVHCPLKVMPLTVISLHPG